MSHYYILTCGGEELGIGHLTRCQCLIPELLKLGVRPKVIVQGDQHLAPFIRVKNLDPIFVADIEKAKSNIIFGPKGGVVIVDYPNLLSQDSCDLYERGANKIISLSSFKMSEFRCDLVIVDDPDLVDEIKIIESRIEVGMHLHMVRPEILRHRPLKVVKLLPGAKNNKILISLGGSDPGEFTEKLLSALLEKNFSEKLVSVVIGAGWSARRKISLLKRFPHSIEFIISPENLGNAIASSNAIITLGGRTTYEAFALGRPVFCVPWVTSSRYIQSLQKNGLAIRLSTDFCDAASNIISNLDKPHKLNQNAEKAFSLVNEQAAREVAKLCVET